VKQRLLGEGQPLFVFVETRGLEANKLKIVTAKLGNYSFFFCVFQKNIYPPMCSWKILYIFAKKINK